MEKKMNRALGTCGNITEELIFVSLEPQRKRGKEVGAKKVFRHIMGENFPNLAETHL